MASQPYDVVIYLRGREAQIIKTQASNPTIALAVAINNARDWPVEEQNLVVGVTLKPEKSDA